MGLAKTEDWVIVRATEEVVTPDKFRVMPVKTSAGELVDLLNSISLTLKIAFLAVWYSVLVNGRANTLSLKENALTVPVCLSSKGQNELSIGRTQDRGVSICSNCSLISMVIPS